jgi:hypothetical protein
VVLFHDVGFFFSRCVRLWEESDIIPRDSSLAPVFVVVQDAEEDSSLLRKWIFLTSPRVLRYHNDTHKESGLNVERTDAHQRTDPNYLKIRELVDTGY